jgi:two-component sensor histidine kinase
MKVDITQGLDPDRSSFSNDHLLDRELTNRINNELASVIGLVSLVAARSTSDDVKDALSSVMSVFHNHARVNRALEMPAHGTVVDALDYIRALCESIRRAMLDHRNIKLMLVACPLQMRSEQCSRLGMIVSKLVANSARHASTVAAEQFESNCRALDHLRSVAS